MSRFHPLRTLRRWNMIALRMSDRFRAAAIRERITQTVGGLILLSAFLFALYYFLMRTDVSDGRTVNAEVVHVGTYPDPLGTGDLPILTVRLPDGTIRVVQASWPAVSTCMPGRYVSLLQRGTALQVGLRGCYAAH